MEGIFRILRGATVLADGIHSGSFVSDGPKINGQRLLDVVPFLDADRPAIYDRTTDTDQCSFTISTTHADFTTALDHALRHGRTVRGVADLRIELTEAGVTTAWLSRSAGWESNEIPAVAGVASAVAYQVICPGWEVLAPGTGFAYARRIFGGAAGASRELLYHGGGAGDTHLNLLRQYSGGTAADR